ncbi:hypothetical protein ACFL0C_01600 [Patescibacteria group bacterium]
MKNNNFCLLVRGKPCSGKSTIVDNVSFARTVILDPDLINKKGLEYKNFQPRQNKNPNEMVKMYCYLFNKADNAVGKGFNVIWMQPWSRIAEIELTIRNFGFYHTKSNNNIWIENINGILKALPFTFAVFEIDVTDKLSMERFIIRNNGSTPEETNRLTKTNKLFQKFSLNTPYLKISGNNGKENCLKRLNSYISTLINPDKDTNG